MKSAAPPTPRDRRLAHALVSTAEAGGAGIVTATRGKLRRLFCLAEGTIVYAASNLIEEQFVEHLVRTGVLSPSERAALVEAAERAKLKVPRLLIESERPERAVLERAMEGLVVELLTSTLEWPDGESSFAAGVPRLDDEITVRLSPVRLLLDHALRYPKTVDAVRVRIGPPDLRPVVSASVPPEAEEDALGRYLVLRADGTTDLARLLAESPAGEEATLRAVYGFLLTGWLAPEDAASRRKREAAPSEPELTRDECLGRLAVSEGRDNYAVLGVDRTARREKVREAYYALARRYHPDRFRSGALADLLPRFEEYFRWVTEAYNTLIDPARRAEYDEQLAAAPAAGQDTQGPDTGYLARQNFMRGRALAAQRKLNEAVTFLENAVKLDPAQAEYHLELGLLLATNPRHREQAERSLLQALDLAPTLIAGYVALGQMYLRAGRPGRAARMAREALRWEAGHADAKALLAEAGDAPDERDEGGSRTLFGRS